MTTEAGWGSSGVASDADGETPRPENHLPMGD